MTLRIQTFRKDLKFVNKPASGNVYTFNGQAFHKCFRAGQQFGNHEPQLLDDQFCSFSELLHLLGLRLLLNTGQSNYLNFVSSGGIKVAIHHQDELVRMEAMGISLSPGFYYSISVRKVRLM